MSKWVNLSSEFELLKSKIATLVFDYKKNATAGAPVALVLGQKETRIIQEEIDRNPIYFASQPCNRIAEGSIEGMHLRGLRIVVTTEPEGLRVV